MSGLRDEIRAILREELVAILAEHSGMGVQSVRIETSDDLNVFARDLVDRISDPAFGIKVKSGEVRFVLERSTAPAPSTTPAPSITAPAIPARIQASSKPVAPVLEKKLITETDLATVAPGTLRVPQGARLTPLAKDEARRKGVRIERIET
jgi:hypothetical protein